MILRALYFFLVLGQSCNANTHAKAIATKYRKPVIDSIVICSQNKLELTYDYLQSRTTISEFIGDSLATLEGDTFIKTKNKVSLCTFYYNDGLSCSYKLIFAISSNVKRITQCKLVESNCDTDLSAGYYNRTGYEITNDSLCIKRQHYIGDLNENKNVKCDEDIEYWQVSEQGDFILLNKSVRKCTASWFDK